MLIPGLTPYDSAMEKLASGDSLDYLEYVAAVLGATEPSQIENTQYVLDDSQGYWDGNQTSGNTVAAATDPSTETVYFSHVNYVGPQVSTTLGALGLPDEAIEMHAAAAGVAPDDFSGWALIAVGAAIIVAVLLAPVTLGGSLLVLYAGYFFAVGLGLVTLGGLYVFLTPNVVSDVCNPAGTSCVLITTSPLGGQNTTTTDCTGDQSGCTSTTQQSGGIGYDLTEIAIGILAIAAVGIGSYATYEYVKYRSHRPYQPPPPAGSGPARAGSYGQQFGQQIRGAASSAYQSGRQFVGGVYQGLRRPTPPSSSVPPGAT